MTKVTKIKNAIKRKVNEGRLRDTVGDILNNTLPSIIKEVRRGPSPKQLKVRDTEEFVDQIDQDAVIDDTVTEAGNHLQNKVYDIVTGMSINAQDSFYDKFAIKTGKLNDFIFRLSNTDANKILRLIKQNAFEGAIKELDVRKAHGNKRIKNSATGNMIKLRTALKAKKGSAVYAKGKAMYNALKDTPANESVKSKLERLKELLGTDVNERAYASTDGKPTFDYDPGEGKVNEGVIGIKTDRDFKVKDLKTALDKAKIKYKMNRLSMTLMVLNLDKKYFKDAKKIIDDVGLSVMEAKESVTEGKLTEAKNPKLTKLLQLGTRIAKNVGEDKLMKLSDAFEKLDDERGDEIAGDLNMAIEKMQDGYPRDATGWLKKFNKECKKALREGKLNEDRFGHPITAQGNQTYIQLEKLIKMLSGKEKRDAEKAFRTMWSKIKTSMEEEEQK